MSDPAGQNGNSVEGDDEHASQVQQDDVLHWKQQAEQARLEAFQLRCVIDAKDKEIQLLRQQLVDQVDLQDHVDQLRTELSSARRQLAVALGSAPGASEVSLGPFAASAAQTHDIHSAAPEQQGRAPNSSSYSTAPAAPPPSSQGNVPGATQQHANPSCGPAHQQHPQQLHAQASSIPNIHTNVTEHLLNLSESVSFQVRSTTATHSWAIAQGALLLGGPRSLLAAAHSSMPPGSHFSSQQGVSPGPGHTSMQSQQYASRLLQAVLAGARPHVLSRIFTFLSEVWGMGVLPYLHMRAMAGDTAPAAASTSTTTNGLADQAPTRQDVQGLPAQNGDARDKNDASTGPQTALSAQTKSNTWAGWEGSQESALASVLADAQQQLLLGKDMDQGDMKHLERLAQLLGVNEIVFGQGAGVLKPSIEWLLAGAGGGTASSISTSQQPFSSTAQGTNAPQAMGDHSHRGSQGQQQDMRSMYQPASERPGYSRLPGVSPQQPRGLGMSMYTLMARLDQQEQERGGYR